MKRLYIVVEGQTEVEFVETLLVPYLQQFGIYSVIPVIIHTSATGKGGLVNYAHLRNKVEDLLRTGSKEVVVTTMVDFSVVPNCLVRKNGKTFAIIKNKCLKWKNVLRMI